MTALPPPGSLDVAYLLDATWLCRRAVEIVGAHGGADASVKIVVRQLVQVLLDRSPAFLAAAFDGAAASWRAAIWPSYKAHRPPSPAALEPTIADVIRWCEVHEIPTWRVVSYEADDLIATAAARLRARGLHVVIVTADKDFAQLLDDSDGVLLWNGKGDTATGAAEVRADRRRFGGVDPARVGDLLALAGDKTDGIPGLRGIGPTKAAKLLELHPTIEHLLSHPDWHPEPLRSELREHAADVRAWRRVVALDRHAPIRVDPRELALGWRDARPIRAFYRERGLLALADEVSANPKSIGANTVIFSKAASQGKHRAKRPV